MAIRQFDYFAPDTLQDALRLLSEYKKSKVLAGGQSIIPLMKLNLVEVDHIIDLKGILGLSSIKTTRDHRGRKEISLGPLVTHSKIQNSEIIGEYCPLLSETARGIGHPLVRNRGTIGGSICHADPAADYCAALLALGARLKAQSSNAERTFGAEEFFLGPFSTALAREEILTEIIVPEISSGRIGYSIKKMSMGHGSFPLVVVSTLIKVSGSSCDNARIALAGVADKPFRVPIAENELIGKDVSLEAKESVLDAAKIVSMSCSPQPDLDASADYKRRMVEVLTRRALFESIERCG
ncbi:MAG TPA: xanthine dehydrogenase family protein subunit M [Nitrososphaerales archaeon]|nr:xanthine dehydrogenase family protein subunit M [Nitrososphaerales archaeon]